MKRVLVAVALTVVLVAGASADDKKIDPAKLVGKWELTKSESGNAPKGAMIEFMKDNKMTITVDLLGKSLTLNGTYKVDGDKADSHDQPAGWRQGRQRYRYHQVADGRQNRPDR